MATHSLVKVERFVNILKMMLNSGRDHSRMLSKFVSVWTGLLHSLEDCYLIHSGICIQIIEGLWLVYDSRKDALNSDQRVAQTARLQQPCKFFLLRPQASVRRVSTIPRKNRHQKISAFARRKTERGCGRGRRLGFSKRSPNPDVSGCQSALLPLLIYSYFSAVFEIWKPCTEAPKHDFKIKKTSPALSRKRKENKNKKWISSSFESGNRCHRKLNMSFAINRGVQVDSEGSFRGRSLNFLCEIQRPTIKLDVVLVLVLKGYGERTGRRRCPWHLGMSSCFIFLCGSKLEQTLVHFERPTLEKSIANNARTWTNRAA